MGGAYFSNSCLPKSLLFNLGVLSGILSAQILAASVTPFVSKTHIENSQCGWQSTKAPEKPTLFLVCSMILTYFSVLFDTCHVSVVFALFTCIYSAFITFALNVLSVEVIVLKSHKVVF